MDGMSPDEVPVYILYVKNMYGIRVLHAIENTAGVSIQNDMYSGYYHVSYRV